MLGRGELELRELNLFLGKNFLVTAHSRPIKAVAEAEKLWLSWADSNDQQTAWLAYLLIDRIVDEYMVLLDWHYGYVGALLVMLGLALALYLYFRRIKWLRNTKSANGA